MKKMSLVSLALLLALASQPAFAQNTVSIGAGVQSSDEGSSPEARLDLDHWGEGLPIGESYHFKYGDQDREAHLKMLLVGKDWVSRNHASYDATLVGPMLVPIGPALISGGVATIHPRDVVGEGSPGPDINNAKFLNLNLSVADGLFVSGKILKGDTCQGNHCSDLKDSTVGIEYRTGGFNDGYVIGASVSNSTLKVLNPGEVHLGSDHVTEVTVSRSW